MSMMVVARQRIIAFHNDFSSFESGWPGWFRADPGYPSNIPDILIQITPDGRDENGGSEWFREILNMTLG